MNAHRQSITAGVVYDVDYLCRPMTTDPDDEREQGSIRAYWTGEIDTWGKHTFVPIGGGDTLYLFRDEITNVERCGVHDRR